jgi:hypothetical protein
MKNGSGASLAPSKDTRIGTYSGLRGSGQEKFSYGWKTGGIISVATMVRIDDPQTGERRGGMHKRAYVLRLPTSSDMIFETLALAMADAERLDIASVHQD